MKYVVVFEQGPENWGAYVPDLPGYAATATTLDELRALVRQGIPFHIAGLQAAGQAIPPPSAVVEAVDVA